MALLWTHARHSIARTSWPAQRTRTSRPGNGAGAVRGGFELGGRGSEAGAGARGVLAGWDSALLRAAGGGRDLPEPHDAPGRRPLSMGEIRFWRTGRLPDGV